MQSDALDIELPTRFHIYHITQLKMEQHK